MDNHELHLPSLPSRDDILKMRMQLYPGLYTSKEALEADIDHFAVDLPSDVTEQTNTATPRYPRPPPTENRVETKSTAVTTRHQTQQKFYKDIWGNSAINEAALQRSVICPVCQRNVPNLNRFAPHLDKCLGIGSMQRSAAANGPGSTRGSSSTR